MKKAELIERAKDLGFFMNPSFQHDFLTYIGLDTIVHETKKFLYFNWINGRQMRFFKESKRVTVAKG